jgi:hypothetical protein
MRSNLEEGWGGKKHLGNSRMVKQTHLFELVTGSYGFFQTREESPKKRTKQRSPK